MTALDLQKLKKKTTTMRIQNNYIDALLKYTYILQIPDSKATCQISFKFGILGYILYRAVENIAAVLLQHPL